MKRRYICAIAVLLSGMLLFSGCDSLTTLFVGEEETTVPFVTSLTVQPDTTAAVAAYYNRLLDAAAAAHTGLARDTRYEINDLQIVGGASTGDADADGTQERDPALKVLNAAAQEVRSFITKSIAPKTESIAYGEDWGMLAPAKIADVSAVTDAVCEMGEAETDADAMAVVYTDDYNGSMTLAAEAYPLAPGSPLAALFPYPAEEQILAELASLRDSLLLEDFGGVFDGNTVSFTANRLADQIAAADYISTLHITARVRGVGALETYGDLTVVFTLKCIDHFTFDWLNPDADTEV
ncbi:MAG: hypothetical protein IJ766_08945 [Clostridia bacterium]|nr:hypothetical protein [Clostridia bacterium]